MSDLPKYETGCDYYPRCEDNDDGPGCPFPDCICDLSISTLESLANEETAHVLFHRGFTVSQIARRLKRTPRQVRYYLASMGK